MRGNPSEGAIKAASVVIQICLDNAPDLPIVRWPVKMLLNCCTQTGRHFPWRKMIDAAMTPAEQMAERLEKEMCPACQLYNLPEGRPDAAAMIRRLSAALKAAPIGVYTDKEYSDFYADHADALRDVGVKV